ncbi:MAG: RND family transporter [Planctomycetota bacterium]
MRIFDRLAVLMLRQRVALLAILVVVTVLAACVLPGLRFDFTPQAMFENRDDANEFARTIRERFGDETNALLVIWRAEGEDAIFTPDVLGGLHDLTARLEAWQYSVGVLSLSSARIPERVESVVGFDLPVVRALTEPPISAERAKAVREMVRGQRLIERILVSKRGDKAMLIVSLVPAGREVKHLEEIVADLRAKLAEWTPQLSGSPSLEIAGLPIVRLDIVQSLQGEQVRLLPIAAGLSLLLLLALFRSLSGVVLPMVSVGAALIWTGAMMVLTGQPFNIINNAMPTLLLVIGLSDGIHVMGRMTEETRAGVPRGHAVRNTVTHMGLACLLTSLTTAIGFASLVAAKTDILTMFGLTTAGGVKLAWVATILFIPLLLTWMRAPGIRRGHTIKLAAGAIAPNGMDRALTATGNFTLRFAWPVMVVGLLVTIVAGIAGSRLVVDTHLLETFPPEHPTTKLVREMESDFAGVLPLQISIEAKEPGYFEDPHNLLKIRELQRRVETYDPDYVLLTRSIADVLVAAEDISGRKFDVDAPNARERVRDGLAALRRIAPELTTRFIDKESRHVLISVRLADLGAARGLYNIKEIAKTISDIFGEDAADADGVVEGRAPRGDPPVLIRLAGDTYLAGIGLMALIMDLLSSLALAGVLVFVTIMILFRSLKLGLISIAPNIFPLVLTFGLMGLLGIRLSVSTVIIFSISLGLAVDDTIHFLSRYREELAAGHGTDEAIRRTFRGAGRAIMMTTFILISGMLVLLNSEFMPVRYLALLTGFTLAGAIVGDLFILPACLKLFDQRPPREDANGAAVTTPDDPGTTT